MDRNYKFLVSYMIAFTIHMPIPVCDGDNIQSGGIQDSDAFVHSFLDIDFVLLGCDLPDDVDDGPVDDDPEDGTAFPFGPLVIRETTISLLHPLASAVMLSLDWLSEDLNAAPLGHERSCADFSFLNFSYGKCCCSGLAVMRC